MKLLKSLTAFFQRPKTDVSNCLKEGIRNAKTDQEFRNIELMIETYIDDEAKKIQLKSLVICYAAVRGVRPIKRLIINPN